MTISAVDGIHLLSDFSSAEIQQCLSLNMQADNIAFGQQMAALITPTDITPRKAWWG